MQTVGVGSGTGPPSEVQLAIGNLYPLGPVQHSLPGAAHALPQQVLPSPQTKLLP